ncbi:hypothetical protein QTO34_012853 [Cnephaeus nilssonii]|uniref:Uncharacterized protein n=1 Tax=Cnephaeus nilssonii TaxID=3371016 RepID=A0AA40HAR7_CNENI|nr:hypothetical protein QTO34_012853 [Eptesicus nilssonii]
MGGGEEEEAHWHLPWLAWHRPLTGSAPTNAAAGAAEPVMLPCSHPFHLACLSAPRLHRGGENQRIWRHSLLPAVSGTLHRWPAP